MTFLDDVIKLVRDWDASRPRSRQAEPGWSEVGGCRSYLGFRLSGAWASDDTDGWGAVRGTAIHVLLESILHGQPGFHTEVTTSYRGIPGHADLMTISEDGITDWKTTRLANSKLWQEKPSALWEKRVQVQGYGAGLIEAGALREDARVRLVVIPVDGTFADWWMHEEPFDRSIADWGADRLDEVRQRMNGAGEPPRDKPYAFCEKWCPFFSMCRSPDEREAINEITDPELAAAVAAYGEANIAFNSAKKEKDRLAPLIRGLFGTAGDWRVSLTRAGEDEPVPDLDAILADFEARGAVVPMTTKEGAPRKLSVRALKKSAATAGGETDAA